MAQFQIEFVMQRAFDNESEKDTSETQNQAQAWSNHLLGSQLVANRNKFGFEIILPNYFQGSLEVEGIPHQPSFSPHLSTAPQEALHFESPAETKVDFETLDRLFNKLNSFDGRLTVQKTYGLLGKGTTLTKRGPLGRNRLTLDEQSGDSSTIYSSYSRIYDEQSESNELSFNKTANVAKEKDLKPKPKGKNIPTKIVIPQMPPDRITTTRGERHIKTLERERQAKINAKEEDERRFMGEMSFIESVKQIIFNDEVNSEILKKLIGVEQEIVLKIVRLRYKGAENFKFPFKNRNFAAYNTRCNFRFVNEKKLVGDIWPSIIDQLKKLRGLWRTDKDQEIVQLFKTYHKCLHVEELKKKVEPNLAEQINEGCDVLQLNLFAELVLGHRQ